MKKIILLLITVFTIQIGNAQDDINLNICNRDSLDEIELFIYQSIQTSINLPRQAISEWKEDLQWLEEVGIDYIK